MGPEFDAPIDVTVSCELAEDLNVTGDVTLFADDCGSQASINYVDETINSKCNNTFNRVWITSDVCGNRVEKVQRITVLDTTPPSFDFVPQDITISCDQDTNPYNDFNTWVNILGNALVSDDCGTISSSFAAVPGSYDINDPNTYPGQHPGALNNIECGNEGFVLQSETVDFVIMDACGNANSSSATFKFIDTIAPFIEDCSEMRTIELNGNACDTSLIFDIPTAFDGCFLTNITEIIFDEKTVSSDTTNSLTLPVNDLNFRLGPIGPEIEFLDNNFFIVKMNNIDAEHPEEVFEIFNEDGLEIATSINTSSACSDTIFLLGPFSKGEIEFWLEDSHIEFTFKAKINATNPENSINDVCLDSRIRIEQTYTIQRSIEAPKYFFKANDGNPTEVTGLSAGTNFGPGENIVQFIAQDCAGNTSFCEKVITIIDNVLPSVRC